MMQETMTQDTTTDVEIRPFHVNIPDEALDDLRRRMAGTRRPERWYDNELGFATQLARSA